MFHDDDRAIIYRLSLVNDAYEHVKHERTIRRYFARMFTKHNKDIQAFVALYLALFVLVAIVATFYIGSTPEGSGNNSNRAVHLTSTNVQFILGATVFGAAVNLVSKLIETAQKRLGTIDLFVSEILSIGRVFTSGNIVGGLVLCFDQLDGLIIRYRPNPPPLRSLPVRYGDALRKENYLSIFDRNSSDLGPFTGDVVSNVTAFYTFLRASRDATGAMSLWSNEDYPAELRKQDIVIIVYYCLLLAIHGREASKSLIEDKHQLKYALEVFHTIELQAFIFLVTTLPFEDPRSGPIRNRKEYYKDILQRAGLPRSSDLITLIDREAAPFVADI